jgi:hypothetical protein
MWSLSPVGRDARNPSGSADQINDPLLFATSQSLALSFLSPGFRFPTAHRASLPNVRELLGTLFTAELRVIIATRLRSRSIPALT